MKKKEDTLTQKRHVEDISRLRRRLYEIAPSKDNFFEENFPYFENYYKNGQQVDLEIKKNKIVEKHVYVVLFIWLLLFKFSFHDADLTRSTLEFAIVWISAMAVYFLRILLNTPKQLEYFYKESNAIISILEDEEIIDEQTIGNLSYDQIISIVYEWINENIQLELTIENKAPNQTQSVSYDISQPSTTQLEDHSQDRTSDPTQGLKSKSSSS